MNKPSKPSIVAIVGRRVHLHKASREYLGRCPFHEDKTPSFSVSDEKGVFHCFGCGESGDVFDFVMKLDGLAFWEACARLGVDFRQPRPQAPDPLLHTARAITRWANEQTLKVNSVLRDIGRQMRLAKLQQQDDTERLAREWIILVDLSEDLQNPSSAISFWQNRDVIKNLIHDAESQAPEDFPPFTEEYREQLGKYVRGYDA